MSKLTDEDIVLIDNFVNTADRAVNQIEHFSGFMRFDESSDQMVVNEGLQLLKNKIKKMKKAESISKLEKVLRVKKVLKNKDGGWL